MAGKSYIEFTPSLKAAPAGQRLGMVPDSEIIDISLYLKPRPMPAGLSRAAFHQHRQTLHRNDMTSRKPPG
jgi:hypothetical protein